MTVVMESPTLVKKLRVPRSELEPLKEVLYARRENTYPANNGARYLKDLHDSEEIGTFVRRRDFFKYAFEMFSAYSSLAFMSLSGLEVRPGDPGIGAHRDYPHIFERPFDPHLCCQFVLSLDGTSKTRAPLWIGKPSNIVPLEPGDLLIYGGNVVHGVHPNTSKRSRMTLLWSMGPTWIRPMSKDLWSWLEER